MDEQKQNAYELGVITADAFLLISKGEFEEALTILT